MQLLVKKQFLFEKQNRSYDVCHAAPWILVHGSGFACLWSSWKQRAGGKIIKVCLLLLRKQTISICRQGLLLHPNNNPTIAVLPVKMHGNKSPCYVNLISNLKFRMLYPTQLSSTGRLFENFCGCYRSYYWHQFNVLLRVKLFTCVVKLGNDIIKNGSYKRCIPTDTGTLTWEDIF